MSRTEKGVVDWTMWSGQWGDHEQRSYAEGRLAQIETRLSAWREAPGDLNMVKPRQDLLYASHAIRKIHLLQLFLWSMVIEGLSFHLICSVMVLAVCTCSDGQAELESWIIILSGMPSKISRHSLL